MAHAYRIETDVTSKTTAAINTYFSLSVNSAYDYNHCYNCSLLWDSHYSKTCLKWPLKKKTQNWFSRPTTCIA